MSRTSPISRLPNEVLSIIFRYIPEGDYPITEGIISQLANVSERWKLVVGQDPFFWSHIALDNPDTVRRVERRLKLSGARPLVLRLDISTRPASVTSNAVLSVLSTQTRRLRYLDLTFHREDTPSAPPTFDMPLLEVLNLNITPAASNTRVWDLRAPRLVSLRLHGFTPSSWSDILSLHTTTVNIQQGFFMPASALAEVLSQCPFLRNCTIAAPFISDFRTVAFDDIAPLVHLKRLLVVSFDSILLSHILRIRALRLKDVEDVTTVCPADATVGSAILALLEGFGPVESLSFVSPGAGPHPDRPGIVLQNTKGFTRRFSVSSGRAAAAVTTNEDPLVTLARYTRVWRHTETEAEEGMGVFDTVRRITLRPGASWRALAQGSPLGAPHLTIELLLDPGEFFSHAFEWRSIKCAGTVTLSFTCSDQDGETVIHREDVDFILRLLGQPGFASVGVTEPEMLRVRMARDKDEAFDALYAAITDSPLTKHD